MGLGWAAERLHLSFSLFLALGGAADMRERVVGEVLEEDGMRSPLTWFLMLTAACVVAPYLLGVRPRTRRQWMYLAVTLAFLAYPLAAILAHPDWSAVARGAFVPSFTMDHEHLLLLVALVGTTLTPYQQLFQQSAVVEKGVGPKHYPAERLEAQAARIRAYCAAQGLALSDVLVDAGESAKTMDRPQLRTVLDETANRQ